jgi:mannose-1-phosphate guanylyltransferase/mannose-6-phosphate isomerase
MYTLILAGGEGSRLWPLSQQQLPKQFLTFGDRYSLLQKTVLRSDRWEDAEAILIVAPAPLVSLIEKDLAKLDLKRPVTILVEPLKKNTAPAIALAVQYLLDRGASSSTMLFVVPADHFLEPEETLHKALDLAKQAVTTTPLVLFGIVPTRADIGFGYIEIGEPVASLGFHVRHFKEKPSVRLAEEYIQSQRYYWNSGMFAFSLAHFKTKLAPLSPSLEKLIQLPYATFLSRFDELSNLSFDYEIVERCKEAIVIPLSLNWSDVGSWDRVYEVLDKDLNRNAKVGQVTTLKTKNSLIVGGQKPISTLGVEDLLIVDTPSALLIASPKWAQEIKSIVSKTPSPIFYVKSVPFELLPQETLQLTSEAVLIFDDDVPALQAGHLVITCKKGEGIRVLPWTSILNLDTTKALKGLRIDLATSPAFDSIASDLENEPLLQT